MSLNRQDLAVAAILIGVGLFFAINTLTALEIGSPLRMGPGFFPIMLSGLLVLVGVLIGLQSFRTTPVGLRPLPWRGLAVLLPVPVFFGLAIRGLGLVPCIAISVAVASFASRQMGWRMALGLTLGLTVFCVVVFHYGLSLPVRLFGPWLDPITGLFS